MVLGRVTQEWMALVTSQSEAHAPSQSEVVHLPQVFDFLLDVPQVHSHSICHHPTHSFCQGRTVQEGLVARGVRSGGDG